MGLLMSLFQPVPIFSLIICLEFMQIAAYYRLRKAYRLQLAAIILCAIACFNFLLVYISAVMFGLISLFVTVPVLIASLAFSWIQAKDSPRKRIIPSDLLLLSLWFCGICFSALLGNNVPVDLTVLHIAVLIIALLLYRPRTQSKQKAKNDLVKNGARLGFTAILILSHVFSYVFDFSNKTYCSWQNARIAAPIIEEIEAYNARMQRYPYEWAELNMEIPDEFCQTLVEFVLGIEPYLILNNCETWGVSLHIVGSTNAEYDFEAKEWHIFEYSNVPLCNVMRGLQ
jgi:hypothetical protein